MLKYKKPAGIIVICAIVLAAVISVGFAMNRASGKNNLPVDEYYFETTGSPLPTMQVVFKDGGTVDFQRFSFSWFTNGKGAAVDAIAPWEADWNASNTVTLPPETLFDVRTSQPSLQGETKGNYRIYKEDGSVVEESSSETGIFSDYILITPSEPGVYFYEVELSYIGNGLCANYAVKMIVEPETSEEVKEISNSDLTINPALQPLETLPADYSLEQAIQDGVYVNLHGIETYNATALVRFYASIDQDIPQPAFVRAMQYTVEGDPIITDYRYDGKNYIMAQDTTRDKFGGHQPIFINTYKYLVSYMPLSADSGYLREEPLRLFSDKPTITGEDWANGGYYELPPLPKGLPVNNDIALNGAIQTAKAYYDDTIFAGKVTAITLIEDSALYAYAVIEKKVKGKVLAFYVEIDVAGTGRRLIVLTQNAEGGWEVINEGY